MIEREERYIVFKIKDLEKYMDDKGLDALSYLSAIHQQARDERGKDSLITVVVEDSWKHEYNEVWKLLEAKVNNDKNSTN